MDPGPPRRPRASRSTVDVGGPWELEGPAPHPCVRRVARPPGLERSAAARGDERRSNRTRGPAWLDPWRGIPGRRSCHAAVDPSGDRSRVPHTAVPGTAAYPVLPRTRYCRAGRRYRLTTDPSAARRTNIGSQTEARLNIFSPISFSARTVRSRSEPPPYGTALTVTLSNCSFEDYGPGPAGKISAIRGWKRDVRGVPPPDVPYGLRLKLAVSAKLAPAGPRASRRYHVNGKHQPFRRFHLLFVARNAESIAANVNSAWSRRIRSCRDGVRTSSIECMFDKVARWMSVP